MNGLRLPLVIKRIPGAGEVECMLQTGFPLSIVWLAQRTPAIAQA